ncbi:MAG TPA: DUF4058 family protein [Pirellulales bacterium]|nr:DUF4058 family protein [Pirellulales bacterium]
MRSPFPGMDPFLEQPAYWPDFHATFVNYWREAIADLLPPTYEATLGERVYPVERDPDERKLGYPDVAVTRDDGPLPSRPHAGGPTATLEPATIPLTMLEGPRETYIEILHRPEHSLATALELLSPANKELPGRVEYLAKRRALLLQKIHLVELDLLLAGRRLPFKEPLPEAHYYYFLSRGERRPDCQVYSWTLRQPLPTLPVPLRHPDPDLQIDLGAVFATVYERGKFFRRVEYQAPIPAFVGEADRHWMDEIVSKPRT